MSRRTLPRLRISLPLLLVLALGPVGGASRAQQEAAEPSDAPPASIGESQETAPEVDYPNLDQGARTQDPRFSGAREVPAPRAGTIDLGEPATVTEAGPLFPLRAISRRLGGKLVELEESVTLVLDDTEVIAGPGNPVMIVGREIIELSQAPAFGQAGPAEDETRVEVPAGRMRQGLLVPLDFLRQSYGRLTEYELSWSPERRELTALRRRPRTFEVAVDVVHLQGVSTVVLRFPGRLDYRLVERGEDVEVHPLRDRLEPASSQPRIRDPLVRDVRVSPDHIRLDLVAGASAESYTLQSPFRLVFDVVRGEEGAASRADDRDDSGLSGDPASGAVEQPLRPETPSDGLNTVVIDPGHGGVESGAVGPSGLLEKDLTLEIARSLRSRLRQRLPVKVVLTRDEDAHLPLDTRSAIANRNKADLFVSIHLNSSMGHEARGAETYFLSMEASDSRAARTAALENAAGEDEAEDEALYDLQLILWDLAQSYHLAASQRVANLIQQELNSALGLRDRGVKQAPFRVLMGAAMPAVLVELGFLSNPDEESKLRDPRYRAELVEALVRAISRFRAEVERSAGGLAPGAIPEIAPPPVPAGADEPAGASVSGDRSP